MSILDLQSLRATDDIKALKHSAVSKLCGRSNLSLALC
jgi:hypothetical protein